MYNENSFKNYIFWIKVKRIFLMLLFSIFGAIIGFFISDYFINVLLINNSSRILITSISTISLFSISLLITSNASKDIQDGYWKIAVLRKLTVISKKLDSLEKLEFQNNSVINNDNESKITNTAVSENSEVTRDNEQIQNTDDNDEDI